MSKFIEIYHLFAYNEMVRYAFLVFITLAITTLISIILRRILSTYINIYSERIKSDPTNFSFFKNSLSFILYCVAAYIIFQRIPVLKDLGNVIFAGAGVLAAIVGFASQKAFSNIISGLFILMFKPFRVDDIIDFSGKSGRVEEITLRHTIIRDFENRRIVVPNAIISDETIINNHIIDRRIKKNINFSISYESNIDKAIQIIQEEAQKHPFFIDGRTDEDIHRNEPAVRVSVISLDDFAISLRAWVWTEDFDNAFDLKCDLLKSVKERFDKEGIEIPYPHRTIVYKTDLTKDAV